MSLLASVCSQKYWGEGRYGGANAQKRGKHSNFPPIWFQSSPDNKNKSLIRKGILFAFRLKWIAIVRESPVTQRFDSASSPFSGISKGIKGNSNILDNKVGKSCLNLLCKVLKSLAFFACDNQLPFSYSFSSGLLLVNRPLGRLLSCEQNLYSPK